MKLRSEDAIFNDRWKFILYVDILVIPYFIIWREIFYGIVLLRNPFKLIITRNRNISPKMDKIPVCSLLIDLK